MRTVPEIRDNTGKVLQFQNSEELFILLSSMVRSKEFTLISERASFHSSPSFLDLYTGSPESLQKMLCQLVVLSWGKLAKPDFEEYDSYSCVSYMLFDSSIIRYALIYEDSCILDVFGFPKKVPKPQLPLMKEKPYFSESSDSRSDERVMRIADLLEKAADVSSDPIAAQLLGKKQGSELVYMDVGCGDMTITEKIQKAFGISRAIGIDMFEHERSGEMNPDAGRLHYIRTNGTDIFVEPKSVDLVTCFVSIHHFSKIREMLMSIVKTMKKGSLLFLREHDATSQDFCEYLNFVHLIDSIARERVAYDDDYFACFFSHEVLKSLLELFGFEELAWWSYDKASNPQHLYHALFRLKVDTEKALDRVPSAAMFAKLYRNKIGFYPQSSPSVILLPEEMREQAFKFTLRKLGTAEKINVSKAKSEFMKMANEGFDKRSFAHWAIETFMKKVSKRGSV